MCFLKIKDDKWGQDVLKLRFNEYWETEQLRHFYVSATLLEVDN